MPGWQPSSGPDAAQNRAELLARLRTYFEDSGALEVDTPSLSRNAVSDRHIESLEVASALCARPLYLHTSPEFAMKRLLAAGYPDIYTICRVFRDGEAGRHHQPEFTLLEWYRHNRGLAEIVEDACAAVFRALGSRLATDRADIVEYGPAIRAACGLDPFDAPIDALATAAGADADLRAALGEHRDDWLDLLLSTKVIPEFAADRLTVLQHYPASQAALARLSPHDPRLADRFEIFLGGIELANGYVELTDAAEQRARIQRDQQERKERGLRLRPVDEDLLAALEHGMPACAGVAMGIERLQMLHDNTDDIREVITFAFGDADD